MTVDWCLKMCEPWILSEYQSINVSFLTNLLHRMGFPEVQVGDFSCDVGGKSYGGGKVLRVRPIYNEPTSHNGERMPPSTLILKKIESIRSQVSDVNFTQREVSCYLNNLFTPLRGELVVPQAYCLGLNPAQKYSFIWMEDYVNAFAADWTPNLLAKAIRDIAELHARWWGRSEELRSMSFLRLRAQEMYAKVWKDRIEFNCESILEHRHRKLIQQVFTPQRCKMLIRLLSEVDTIYAQLDRLPQTLLHQDIWLPNLGKLAHRTVLIDWSYAGPGTPGSELSWTTTLLLQMWGEVDDNLLLDALYNGLQDWAIQASLDTLWEGYEISFCLRPAHTLGGPILSSILSGHATMVGLYDIELQLRVAESIFERIERGLHRLT